MFVDKAANDVSGFIFLERISKVEAVRDSKAMEMAVN